MIKLASFILVLACIAFSCRRSGESNEATSICNCFDKIHDENARNENKAEIQEMTNICSQLLIDKLESFGADEEKSISFMKEYRACQEN